MVRATNLGYPRLGPQRELKKALEKFWHNQISETELLDEARRIRFANWNVQRKAGIAVIPSNDFSLYDHVLDTVALVGAVPDRYQWAGDTVDLLTYFAMARGSQREVDGTGLDVVAMEMTKWFDTNYHYIVPEFHPGQTFHLASTKVVDEFSEAREASILTRPVLLGPVSFFLLGKTTTPGFNPLDLLPDVLPIYAEVLKRLAEAGADWVQIDEPCLVLDIGDEVRSAYQAAYRYLRQHSSLKLLVTTYFGALEDNLPTALGLPVDGLHIDLVRAPSQLAGVLDQIPASMTLSLGVVDGRNVWRTDLDRALAMIEQAVTRLGPERVLVGPSCSLLFSPQDLALESHLDQELLSWLAFARQKLDEITTLARAAAEGPQAVADLLAANRAALQNRAVSRRTHDPMVRDRVAVISAAMLQRTSPAPTRKQLQQQRYHLPLLPTTTIGSFPQTREIRKARADFQKGIIDQQSYEAFIEAEIEAAIRFQDELGLDVLVHGEFERTDMVEYFGKQLTGVIFTEHGWVQSYGSRAVRPPIIFGDVARPTPMTVRWSKFAQGLTARPVKAMLTGPVTILQWSFVRDDQPREDTCRQIALAIRDEVLDLEQAGLGIIQIDEPAFREGLPLRKSQWDHYLTWAVECFRLASGGVRDETQIHTHMCYAEFNDIIGAISALDADVISIETSRSQMQLLDAFVNYQYANDIGPGVYDIHSPRVPDAAEMKQLLAEALRVVHPDQLWVNPDCGLKTRDWNEVKPALKQMVAAAHALRATLSQHDA